MEHKKKDWIRDKSKQANFRQINDIIHEQIQVFHPIQLIIDTLEFQRLRHIQQLGICYLVYPSANHCRFTHSLGVYALADSFIKELAESYPELEITPSDQLCVIIAALVHDLGHGPFSHLYEEFLRVTNPEALFRHETNSTKIFEVMLQNNSSLKETLDEYLEEQDYEFIAELIDPPPAPFIVNGNWKLKGRSKEKSFLYDLVSNKHTGLDVDKFDYFLRDSNLGNMPIPFSMATVSRIRNNAKALEDEEFGYKRLIFASKNLDEIKDAFESRVKLHDRLYHHKTCVAAEILLIEALCLANPYLTFKTGDKSLCLSNAFLDPLVFLRIDDRIIYRIMMSDKENFSPAKTILSQLQLRNFPRYLRSISLDNYEKHPTSPEEVKRGVLLQSPLISNTDIIVKVHCIHRGLGASNSPLSIVKIYDREDSSIGRANKTWLKYNSFLVGGKGVAYIYAPFQTPENIMAELRTAVTNYEASQSSSEQSTKMEIVGKVPQPLSSPPGLRRTNHFDLEYNKLVEAEYIYYRKSDNCTQAQSLSEVEGQKEQLLGICDVMLFNVKGVLERIWKIVRWTEQCSGGDSHDILSEYEQKVWPSLEEVDSQMKILSQTVRQAIDCCSIKESQLEWLLKIHKFQVSIEHTINNLTGKINEDIERVLRLKVRGGGLIGLRLNNETVEEVKTMQSDMRLKNFRI